MGEDENNLSYSNTAKKYLAEFVYGSTDGTVTTFAIIAGSIGALLSAKVILILGFANLLADGFSMAASNYLSAKSEIDIGKGDGKPPIKSATVTFFSFVIVGFVPLFSFVIAPLNSGIESNKFLISIILTSLAFFVIGGIKGIVTGEKRIISAIESLIIGSLAALISFIVGYLLRDLV